MVSDVDWLCSCARISGVTIKGRNKLEAVLFDLLFLKYEEKIRIGLSLVSLKNPIV